VSRWAAAGLLALAAAAPLPVLAAPAKAEYWAYRKPIVLPAAPGRFVEVLLDADVYGRARSSLADLRIRDGAGIEVAYVLRRHEKIHAQMERPLPLQDLGETARGEARFVLDLGRGGGRHNRVKITLAEDAKNFRVPVRVDTSRDGRQWQLVRAAGFIYDVEGESRAADTSVSYPVSTARYVRVTVAPWRGRPLPVEGATLAIEIPDERDEEVLPVTLAEQADDPAQQVSRYVVDLGSRRPVDRAELDVVERTFHRVVTIEAGEDRARWRWAGSGALSAIEVPALSDRQTSLRFAETPARSLRLTIQNLDDRPLHVAAVRAFAVRRGLVFEPEPGRSYVLDYGHPSAPAPRYDLGRALRYVESERIPAASLGPARPLEPPAPKALTERHPAVLWAAMAGAVLALGGLLLRLARRVRVADE
jgi:hypothetical protein